MTSELHRYKVTFVRPIGKPVHQSIEAYTLADALKITEAILRNNHAGYVSCTVEKER